jgi:hypothetical protein
MIQNMLESTSDELGSIDAPRRSREWAVAQLLVVAAALFWISWRVGSPLMSGICDFDVKSEILRLQKRPPGPPDFVIP